MSIATLTFHLSNNQKADEIIFPSKSDKVYTIEADGEDFCTVVKSSILDFHNSLLSKLVLVYHNTILKERNYF